MKNYYIPLIIVIISIVFIIGIYIFQIPTKSPSIITSEEYLKVGKPGISDDDELHGPILEDDFLGMRIKFLDFISQKKSNIFAIRGAYRTFVQCGTQTETWSSFNQEVHIELRNIDTGIKIEIKGPLNKPSLIGRTLNDFQSYPCNKLLRGYFAWNLSSLTKIDIAKGKYSARASYKEELSNEIIVDYQ